MKDLAFAVKAFLAKIFEKINLGSFDPLGRPGPTFTKIMA